MGNLRENLQNGGWIRFVIIFALVTVIWSFMRKKADKMERDIFDGDESRYRADENGVSPFDRPPVNYHEDQKKATEDKKKKIRRL